MTPVETSIGRFRALFSERGLRRLCFPTVAPFPDADPPAAREADLARELEDYFEGRRQRFTVPLDLQGTAFQREVWRQVLEIPYGSTRTYSEVARAMGRPLAARAVGAANGANPVPILVPCHRLVGASGDLTGYGGGIELKRWLLRLESGPR
jgi:O-6-methylguanine DNA methyltransferase